MKVRVPQNGQNGHAHKHMKSMHLKILSALVVSILESTDRSFDSEAQFCIDFEHNRSSQQ